MSQSQPYSSRPYRGPRGGGKRVSRDEGESTASRGDAIWSATDPTAWHDFAGACLANGALASISTSSDGGVLHTFILHGATRHDNYAHDAGEAEHAWAVARDLFHRWGCIPSDTKGW